MKAYCIQFSAYWENKGMNYKKVLSLVGNTKIIPESLILLPEMFATGFSLNSCITTADEPSRTESFLSTLSKNNKSWVIGGMTKQNELSGKTYNTAVTFNSKGEKVCEYSKIHPIPMLHEDKVHHAGKSIKSFNIGSFIITPAICYDLRFADIFRSALQYGTNLFVVLGCWPKLRINHWITLLQARAIENQAFVIGVNRIGKDQGLIYGGHSLIIDPMGEIIADGGESERIIEAEIKSSVAKKWRVAFPIFEEMKKEI